MDQRHKKFLAAFISILMVAMAMVALRGYSDAASARPVVSENDTSTVEVSDPSEVPDGASVVDTATNKDCSVTTTWLLVTPATDEITHQEWGTEERARTAEEVIDYKTQYHFRKFTHTKTGTKHGNTITWGDYGPWTPWEPETHTSWEDSDAPLGSPAFHGKGHNGNRYWYREWQAQFDGQTRLVEIGSHTEYSEWTEWTTRTSGELVEPVLPPDTDTREYRITGPVMVKDSDGTPEILTYYIYTDDTTCDEEPPGEEEPPKIGTPKSMKKWSYDFCAADGLRKIKYFVGRQLDHVEFENDPTCDIGVPLNETGM